MSANRWFRSCLGFWHRTRMWMWCFARLWFWFWFATSLTHAVHIVEVPTLDSGLCWGSWPRYEHLHLSCQSIWFCLDFLISSPQMKSILMRAYAIPVSSEDVSACLWKRKCLPADAKDSELSRPHWRNNKYDMRICKYEHGSVLHSDPIEIVSFILLRVSSSSIYIIYF